MNKSKIMHVCNRRNNLAENRCSICLAQTLEGPLLNVVVQVPSLAQLKDQVAFCRGVKNFIEFHDVRMLHAGQNINLPMDCHELTAIVYHFLFVSF